MSTKRRQVKKVMKRRSKRLSTIIAKTASGNVASKAAKISEAALVSIVNLLF